MFRILIWVAITIVVVAVVANNIVVIICVRQYKQIICTCLCNRAHFFMLLFASSIQLFVCKLALNQCDNAILDQWMALTWSGHPFILPLKTHNLRNDFPNWFPMKYKTVNSFLIMVWSWKALNKIENWNVENETGMVWWWARLSKQFVRLPSKCLSHLMIICVDTFVNSSISFYLSIPVSAQYKHWAIRITVRATLHTGK